MVFEQPYREKQGWAGKEQQASEKKLGREAVAVDFELGVVQPGF